MKDNNPDNLSHFGSDRSAKKEINSFEDLLAWKIGFQLAKEVYEITSHFPASERFGLTAQLRRSASSIPANIAEGFGRHTFKEYLRFLVFARGSVAETQSHLLLANAVGFLAKEELDRLLELCLSSRKTIQGLIRHLRNSMAHYNVSERAAEYGDDGAMTNDGSLPLNP